MIGIDLVRPLEPDWRGTLDQIARAHGWPSSADVGKLGACVAALSDAYNDPSRARASMRDGRAAAARLGFAFARDVPKAAAAVRELIATGRLRIDGTLRVLDVGAGLGASTWGLVRALDASGARGVVEATWLDQDAHALAVAAEIARARGGRSGAVRLVVRTAPSASAAYDVLLLGQVLSEMDVGDAADARVETHAALVAELLSEHVEPAGSLVIVEPALRDRSRHLHRVRDALAARGLTPFAPCLHAAACPALARESDWCHEDLCVDLPDWLVPVARAAGLRREGLTLAYLVVQKDGSCLVDAVPPAGARVRAVSSLLRTKGKREIFLCGDFGGSPARARVMRLDRDASELNGRFERLGRGDLLTIDPPPDPARGDDRARLGKSSSVRPV